MKNICIIIIVSLTALTVNAQKIEKIKGSKIVTIEQKKMDLFSALEVENDLDVFLVKGSASAVEVEADDNLHETIETSVLGGILYIRTNKKITSAKKVSIRVVYTDDLKRISTKDQATITALADLQLESLIIKAIDQSKLFLNASINDLTISLSDKTKTELNIKSKKIKVDLDKNAVMKALIASNQLNIDLYNKSNAVIEGDAEESRIRIDNNATFESKNFSVKTSKLVIIDAAKASINSAIEATIEASGKSEVYIYGDGKVVLEKFLDNAVIMKKK